MTELSPQERVQAARKNHLELGAVRQKKLEVIQALRDAGNHEKDVRTRIADLDKTEAGAMSKWAAGGAKGNAPGLDHAKREGLNRELSEAVAKTQAAEAASRSVQTEVDQLHQQCGEAFAAHKIESLAYLTSFAAEIGEEYRQARIQVERSKAMLLTLDQLLSSHQSTDDHRTTAFLPLVQPHIEQRDFYIEQVQAEAMNDATQHWQQLWAKCMKGEF